MPASSIIALSAAALAQVAAPAPAAAPGKGGGLQVQFDAASTAAEAGDCATALRLFQALEASGRLRPGSMPAAASAVRKGQCLVRTGDDAGGEAAILAGLPTLERQATGFTADLALSYAALGGVALRRYDYAAARRRYEQALPLSDLMKASVLGGLARATAFDPGPQPLAYADEGLKLVNDGTKASRESQAVFHTLRGRILLNRGDPGAALASLKQALALSGGLTLSKVTLSEVSMRGDLANAALLAGDKAQARLYLAYTGAGRIAQSPFASASGMTLPACGADSGLKPEDFAIVEFSVNDEGAVTSATPIYTRAGPRVAALFANAVRRWTWTPEQAKAIPAFYRTATRVELRCTTAAGSSVDPGVPLLERFTEWALPVAGVQHGLPDQGRYLATLREKLTSMSDPAVVAAAGGLVAIEPGTSAQEAARTLDIAVAHSAGMPAPARNALLIIRALAPKLQPQRGSGFARPDRAAQRALLQTPEIAADPLAAATLRVALAQRDDRQQAPADAADLLRQVADDGKLTPRHPLRQYALLELANQAARRGDFADAQQWFARTGLTEEQCALVGARPAMKRSGIGSEDFPAAALAFGFEGFIQLEFDIAANGRVVVPRTVIAYPPFVFSESARDMTAGMRFETSYRPSAGKACTASRQIVNFRQSNLL